LVLGPLDDLLRDARERLSERMRNQLQLAQRNARRVLDLIVELLDVNRLEQGHLQLNVASHDLVLLLRRVMAENAPLVERFGQTLTIECGEIASAPSAVDPVQIERALGNLIGNAAKYSPRGTTISLSLAQSGQYWLIAVSDEGRGISPEALPHVFDRFFQSDGSTTASGYGIGLSLVREIASAHGGEVTASSTLGVGSRFELKLAAAAQVQATEVLAPVDDAEPSNSATATAAIGVVETDRGHRERVLVVDDHDDLRQRVRELLAHRFEVIEAADGDQAWQLARDELPDLIVSDVMMPGCDGVDLSKRLRSHPDTQAIGILLLTAKAGSEHAVAGLRAGANDYLSKPFDASELLARCEAIVAHARRLQHRLAAAAPALPPESTVVDHPDRRWRQRLDQSIAAYLHESQFDVEALAKCMHADRTQLFRKCKELLGQSPSDYLRDARLAHGHRLLEQAAGSISEVAYASGFDSLSSFTRAFKVRYGVPPSQVRRAA
jgi:DNA-binding response OmpR family regulator